MSDQSTNYSRQQTVGGSRIAGNLNGGAGVLLGLYEITNPYGRQRADFNLVSIAADGACTVWLSDNLQDFMNGAQAKVPTDIPNPNQLQPFVFNAAFTLTFHDNPVEGCETMYMLVNAAADNIHAWVSYSWTKEAVRLDFYNAVFKAQEAAVMALRAAEEVSRATTWLDKLRQIPAPWNMPGQGQAANKERRSPPPQLFQQRQATQMSPGQPDIPRSKGNRLTRG